VPSHPAAAKTCTLKLVDALAATKEILLIGIKLLEKHLIILGIRGVPAAHGGFESFAERLAPWMVERGWQVTIYCQGSATGRRYEDTWQGCRRVHVPIRAQGALGTIEFDVKSTIDAMRQNAVLLTLGYNTGFLSAYVRVRKRRNIINMDGVEWRRAKYNKIQKAYLWINERLAAASGNVLIADHPEIARHHASHVRSDKIRMIPYGGEAVCSADKDLLSRFDVEIDSFFTVIARPEPENSLFEIVRSFSRKRRNARLVVLGEYAIGNAYQAKVLSAASDEVIFPGAIYDQKLLHAFRLHSRAYIHGHQVGGTNPSLVEALGAGNAVIAHDNAFNRWVAGNAGCYFTNEDECETQIESLLHDGVAIHEMRNEARQRWSENFTWERVLTDYHYLLESAL